MSAPVSPLVEQLVRLSAREDRAALAALRRGLGKPPGAVADMYPHVLPYIPASDRTPDREAPYFLLASLYAAHPAHSAAAGNLGATCHNMAGNESANRRFRRLLEAGPDELPVVLRQVIRLAAAKDHPVDYATLLRDLRHWTHPDRWVQRDWASSFWSQQEDNTET